MALNYIRLSENAPIKGAFKQEARDFVVEEITKNGTVLGVNRDYGPEALGMEEKDGRFSVFIMQKENWNTAQALKEVAKSSGRGIRSVGFAGTKDRISVSTQLCSLFGADPSRLRSVHVKDIKINGAWKSDREVKLGELLGNRFGIKIQTSESDAKERIGSMMEGHRLFPNYFGSQRFGLRENNFGIGLNIIKGNFEEAAMLFLADSNNEENGEAVAAREKLAKERDFAGALSYFPRYLKYERIVLDYLARNPTDYANALRRLPRSISLMFVHSVESQIFNDELSMRIKDGALPNKEDIVCREDFFGFPDVSASYRFNGNEADRFVVGNIVGYGTKELTEREAGILDRLDIKTDDFRVKRMPELNCRGQRRVLFAPYKDFSSNYSEHGVELGFSIPAGAYATSLLNEFFSFC